MTRMDEVFQMICKANDPVEAVRGLDDEVLRMLCKWFAGRVQSGIPHLVEGLCEVECARRFMERGNG